MSIRDLRRFPLLRLIAVCAIEKGEEPVEAGGGGEELSLRDELAAALDADANSGDAVAAPAPAAATPTDPSAQTAEQRARDEQGRFSKTPDQPKPEPNAPGAVAAQGQAAPAQASGPPPSWSAAAKAEWDKLPDLIRQEAIRQEASVQQAKAQWAQKGERLNRLDAVLAPRSERFRLAGIDEAKAIEALFAAQDYLTRDPMGGIAYLARQYGVDLRSLAQGVPGAAQPQQAQLHPAVQQAIQAAVKPLNDAMAQQRQAADQAQRSQSLDQVGQFAADPAHVYFENVRDRMASLLASGAASDLKNAYEMACWSDPEIRPLLLRQQAEEQQRQAREAAGAKAAQARHASGSVTGSPAPGATPGGAASRLNASVRDDLEAAFDAFA